MTALLAFAALPIASATYWLGWSMGFRRASRVVADNPDYRDGWKL